MHRQAVIASCELTTNIVDFYCVSTVGLCDQSSNSHCFNFKLTSIFFFFSYISFRCGLPSLIKVQALLLSFIFIPLRAAEQKTISIDKQKKRTKMMEQIVNYLAKATSTLRRGFISTVRPTGQTNLSRK